jgi:hypothetical protein
MEKARRRPTRDIEKLLEISEDGYRSLIKSKKYAEVSRHKNRDKWFQNIREMEVAWFAFIAALKWVLGIGLTEYEKERALTEWDDAPPI